MQIDISFRHMETSDALREYVDEKIRRVIRKHIRDDFDAQVTLSVEKFRHIANFHLSYKGISIKCEESSEDMYTSIDLALDKLERQIQRYKDKLRTRKPKQANQRLFDFTVVALSEKETEDAFEENINEEIDLEHEENDAAPHAKVLKHEKIAIESMSIDDAVMRIELENKNCYVFVNEDTNTINVLYRMDHNNFGLIDSGR